MNFKTLLVVALLPLVVEAVDYSPSETNRIISQLLMRQMADEGPDCFESFDGPAIPREINLHEYTDLFATGFAPEMPGNELTSEELREIFETFMFNIPNISTNNPFSEYSSNPRHNAMHLDAIGRRVFGYCEDHDYTNSLAAAMNIMTSPFSQCQSAARSVFVKFARPSDEIVDFIERIIASRDNGGVLSDESEYFLDSLSEILIRDKDVANPSVISNGVRLIHRFVDGRCGCNIFDFMMSEIVPGYATSSNRLAFAIESLNAPSMSGRINSYDVDGYFAPITNELLSASEPLNVLDLSWLDDAGGAPSMQSNAADEDAGSGLPVDEQSSTSSVLSVIRDFFAAIWEWLCGLFG